jgi:arylamine N-acetyltransferase
VPVQSQAFITSFILRFLSPAYFVSGVESVPTAAHRIVNIGGDNFKLQVINKGEWDDLYRFNLLESYPSDWEIGSHYCSTFELSKFVNNIIVTRFADSRLYVLVNKELTIRKHMSDCEGEENGIIESRDITSQRQFKMILNDIFDIKLEEGEGEGEGEGGGVAVCPPGTSWEDL